MTDLARRADLRLVPTERYTSAVFAGREAEAVWGHVWQMVCREEDLPHPGDCFTHTIVDQPVVVVRTPSGALRAFHNVCLLWVNTSYMWISLYVDPTPRYPSYMTNGLCGEHSDIACPAPGVPIPTPR